ncbi:transposase [Schinkia azotoformans MEV2011]|uniref:Transposase n=1 Tax=Schinkia azotoformans MEV2011 TaxID=1348973 RepID=A0A072NE92_SCHAZ|nr:IS200/IS605 family transposase [Schinkia azotoformans]KEF35871.1 transposase [Schinkia azotoformans MEV2011]MEC1697667.1 IS200/IS605 family transposase [Schinkia azotoformans]MEC1718297.1 IS200/IS605 family transposase [Schinkia azotoformans]MEC1727326.1 IS200/IS605 family transposase [Schinkia azotoformans]MEC1742301.1 IS200/IS605 family transposase [Schinkia azotoformans]
MITKLDSNNHSVFSLYYHLVFVTKYRRSVLNNEISDYLKDHFIRLLEPKGITLEEWNHGGDHVHILFRSVPNIDLSKAINSYKSVSSRFVKRDFPQIKHDLWKEMFWSRSYCLLTTGSAPIETIRKYIESQGMNES